MRVFYVPGLRLGKNNWSLFWETVAKNYNQLAVTDWPRLLHCVPGRKTISSYDKSLQR